MFDASHFGREFAVYLFRTEKVNLHWTFRESEKIIYYEEELTELRKKYSFVSFTIDGRRGVIYLLQRLFPSVPVQLCQFHQAKTILKYTTRRPQTDCGKELKRLALSLKSSSKEDFIKRYETLKTKYKEFLKEKNESGQYKHRRLRTAFRSIKTNLPYLFTFQDFPYLKIPNTTNSCDGYFSHLKSLTRLHPGISLQRKIQMINHILAS